MGKLFSTGEWGNKGITFILEWALLRCILLQCQFILQSFFVRYD